MSLLRTVRSMTGNKVGIAIEEQHRAENELADALLDLADLHRTDHEIFHVARDIARWSHQHVRRLAEIGGSYGVRLDPEPHERSALVAGFKHKSADLLGRYHEPSLLLLGGLRHVHRLAAGASLDWEVLAQTAQALEDADLLAVAQECHPQTLRQQRWANAKLKELAAQTMVTG